MQASSVRNPLACALLFLVLFGLPCAPNMAKADEFSVASHIQAVTVFPTGAEITRAFSVDFPVGEHVVKITLPNDVQRNSIQIQSGEGAQVRINSLDLRPASIDADARKTRDAAIAAEIAAFERIISENTKKIENSRLSRELIETLARRTLQPQGPETSPPVPEPQHLIALLDMVDVRLSEISELVLAAQGEIDASRARISELENALLDPIDPQKRDMLASIYVTAASDGKVGFKLSYRLQSASWQPLYEARLSTGESGQAARLELVRNASVTQDTTEDWTDVELKISTAQRTARISPPVLGSQTVRQFARDVDAETAQLSTRRDLATALQIGKGPQDAGDGNRFSAEAASAGFNLRFDIPGRVTIDHSGIARTVRIQSGSMPADLSLFATPKIDLTAYLVAEFTVQSEAPLLPGRVMLFRDGVFIGEAVLPLTMPGETLKLGFGADDLVRIERHETGRKSGETGLVSTAYIEERTYLTQITSRHSFDIPITIEDQTPVTDDERIRVELLSGTTRPDVEDVGDRSGVYSWTRVLKPFVPQEIGFGFRVTWPKGISR